MTLFEAVRKHIKADSTLNTALTRIVPIYTPEEAKYPWAVVRRVSTGTSYVSHDGDGGLNLVRIEVTIWDDDVARAEKLISKVRTIFKGFTGNLGATNGNGGVRFSNGAFAGPRSVFHPDTASVGMQLDILGLLDEDTIS